MITYYLPMTRIVLYQWSNAGWKLYYPILYIAFVCESGINDMITQTCVLHDIYKAIFYVVSEDKPYPSLVERWTVLFSWAPGTGPTPLIYTCKTKNWVRPSNHKKGRHILNRDLLFGFAKLSLTSENDKVNLLWYCFFQAAQSNLNWRASVHSSHRDSIVTALSHSVDMSCRKFE